jgi:hypothetical protein
VAGKADRQPETEIWARFREPREPDLLSLPLFVDAAAPVVLELGYAASSTLEMTVHLRGHRHRALSPAGSPPDT